MSSRRSTLLGLQKINSSRINSDYVDHHRTRVGKTVIYTLPSDENVVDVLLVVVARLTLVITQAFA